MFNCKKLFKLQVRPPSLILLITTSQDRWIFPSQSWEVKNSMMMMMMIIITTIKEWGFQFLVERSRGPCAVIRMWFRLWPVWAENRHTEGDVPGFVTTVWFHDSAFPVVRSAAVIVMCRMLFHVLYIIPEVNIIWKKDRSADITCRHLRVT